MLSTEDNGVADRDAGAMESDLRGVKLDDVEHSAVAYCVTKYTQKMYIS